MSRQRIGFTLIEMVSVVAIIGLMVAVSAPRIKSIRERTNLRAARDEIASALATARSAAVQKGVNATFYARGTGANKDTITVLLNSGQEIMPVRPLYDLYGAKFTVAVQSDTTITFDSRGFASRANTSQAKYRVTVGSLTDSVCVSKLGLVTKLGCVN